MARARKCPICGSRTERSFDPFCSQRCANLDLANWLNGEYRIPADDEPTGDEPSDEEEGEPLPRLN